MEEEIAIHVSHEGAGNSCFEVLHHREEKGSSEFVGSRINREKEGGKYE